MRPTTAKLLGVSAALVVAGLAAVPGYHTTRTIVSYDPTATLFLVEFPAVPFLKLLELVSVNDGHEESQWVGPIGASDGSIGPEGAVMWTRPSTWLWPAETVLQARGRGISCDFSGEMPVWREDGEAVAVTSRYGAHVVSLDGGCQTIEDGKDGAIGWRDRDLVWVHCAEDCAIWQVLVGGRVAGSAPAGIPVQAVGGLAVQADDHLFVILDGAVVDMGDIGLERLPFPSFALERRRSGLCGRTTCWRFADGRTFVHDGYPLDVDITVRADPETRLAYFFDLDSNARVPFPSWGADGVINGLGSNRTLIRADGSVTRTEVGCRDPGAPESEW